MDTHKPDTGHRFFSWMRSTGLTRPDEGWIGGVFAGIAEKTGWDAALVRGLGVVAFIIFFSPVALLYGLAWILMPSREGEIHAEQAVRGNYSSGFIGGAALAVIGALNIFTPISLAGPLAVLLNLVVLGIVAWVVYAMVQKHRRGSAPVKDGVVAQESAASGSMPGKPRAGEPTSLRADGKPAWYPREEAATGQPPLHEASVSASGSADSGAGGATASRGGSRAARAPGVSPQERAERRRRRQLTWGLGLLALPAIVALVWFSGSLGFSGLTVALLATAALVLLLGLGHLVAALRGRPGVPGLLGLSTVTMLVLFAGHSGAGGFGGASNHAFGSYETTESQVNSVFSNTTVDLSDLATPEPGDSSIPSQSAEVNNAFANTTVIVPDDARVVLSNGQALSNLEVLTSEDRFNQSGISGEDLVLGPEDPEREILLELNSAFGNIAVYDSTTYAQEAGADR